MADIGQRDILLSIAKSLNRYNISYLLTGISPEDLILTKLLWNKEIKSERHLKDCKGILEIQENKLDYVYLKYWVKKLKISKLYTEISSA